MADTALVAAQLAVKNKELERALELYNQAVDAEPTAAVLAARAALQNRLKNHIEAAADASRAIELDAGLAAAHKEKGSAYFALEEFESAKEAFEAAAALEPGKRIHKQWVEMCKAQLGEELEPPPTRPISPPRARAPAPEASASAGGAGAEGAEGGGGGGNTLTLSGPELQRFLRQQELASKAQAAAAAREAEEGADISAQPRAATVDDPEFSKYWGHTVSPALVATLPERPTGKYRHQWFQSSDKVEVAVLAKGLKQEQVSVGMETERLQIDIRSPEGGEPEYSLALQLHAPIVPEESKFSVLSTKVEVRLKKAAPGQQWPALEAGGAPAAAAPVAPEAAPAGPPPPPYAGKKVDWDRLESQLKAEEKDEKLEGDAALNKFFRELYSGADDDTRRAMVKSMQESGGTALSTNWKEVAKKTYKPGGDNDD